MRTISPLTATEGDEWKKSSAHRDHHSKRTNNKDNRTDSRRLLHEQIACKMRTVDMIMYSKTLAYTTTCTQHDPKHEEDQEAQENDNEVY